MDAPPILVAGTWRSATVSDSFRAFDPTAGRPLDTAWPVSGWADVDAALDAAVAAARDLEALPDDTRATFLGRYAARLEARAADLIAAAHAETGLAVKPRLADVELPRMLDQLRQAAAAAREGTWRMAMIDTVRNIRSAAFGLGPVVVFPPGNFPFAYGAVTGGDFAAAIAAGNPVIAKAHPGCPTASLLAAGEAVEALREAGLPPATVQLVHGLTGADGERLVADSRVGATGFTGGQEAGKKLLAAAAAAGRVMWVEMGSINPVVILPGAVAERGAEIADELTASVTGSAGQFCTKPGLVFLVDDAAAGAFVGAVRERFAAVGEQVLLGPLGRERLMHGIARLRTAGAHLLAGADPAPTTPGCRHAATLLEVTAAEVRSRPDAFFIEAFGNATLVVRAATLADLAAALSLVPGALGASLYLAKSGCDDHLAPAIQRVLEARTGRLVENRMPTGLAVTPPLQHGGPWPSATPPFFSAVGMPWSLLRFARRLCFDAVSPARLPECLRDEPPPGRPWRYIDHVWTRGESRG